MTDILFIEIKALIEKALGKYRSPADQSVVTDIYIMPIRETGDFCIMDDDQELAVARVSALLEIPYNDFYKVMEGEVTKVLAAIDSEQPLDSLAIWKPFSFVLVDEDHETVAELMLLDDDNAILNHTLMEGLDDELNQFLKDLLA